MLKMRILSSVATLEAHKSENGVGKSCYEYKKNTIELIFEFFLKVHGGYHPT